METGMDFVKDLVATRSEFCPLVQGQASTETCLWDVQVLEEHCCSNSAWQVSHTRTGFGEEGSGSSLSEQALQKISPQFLQWC